MTRTKTALLLGILTLLVLNGAVFYVLTSANERPLLVSFLSVGQGDAILIQTPSGEQVLIDGGPDRSVLRELPKKIGPLDRDIDMLIATHPDKDHIAGLSEVLAQYEVDSFVEPLVPNDTSYAKALVASVASEEGIQTVVARRGMRIHMGDGVYADVLYPDRDVAGVEANTGSIVMQLVYGETEFLLSGDAPIAIEDWLVRLDGKELESDVLKAGHHGSRTSTSQAWVDVVDPKFVVVSAGKGNSYGHPHEEVVSRVSASGATMLSTMEGAVTFVSDGKSVWAK